MDSCKNHPLQFSFNILLFFNVIFRCSTAQQRNYWPGNVGWNQSFGFLWEALGPNGRDPTTAPDRRFWACWGHFTRPKTSHQSLWAVCFSLLSPCDGSHSQKTQQIQDCSFTLRKREKGTGQNECWIKSLLRPNCLRERGSETMPQYLEKQLSASGVGFV